MCVCGFVFVSVETNKPTLLKATNLTISNDKYPICTCDDDQ